ncbi:MAG TPA: hypothetical protein VD932_05040, partial [Aquabacterium sp.]|nr:hypothetical protein [Aquabacterium sp.]
DAAIAHQAMALIVLGFAAAIVAILVLGQYASSARVRGIVAYDQGIARVYPASPAEIREYRESGDVAREHQREEGKSDEEDGEHGCIFVATRARPCQAADESPPV